MSFRCQNLKVVALLSQSRNRSPQCGEMQNKLPVIVRITQEVIDSTESHQARPVEHSRLLLWVYEQTSVRNQLSQKWQTCAFKDTLLQLGA